MNIKTGTKFHNRFDIEVRNAVTGEIKQKGYAENIILDQMYTRLCNLQTYFVNIHFGTGAGTLAPTRTSLFAYLGTKTAVTIETIYAHPTSKWVRKITLNPEEYVGSTITEVGIAFGSTASNLVTHAMIKDSEGNPLSLTKTALDVLIIYATIFIEFSSSPEFVYSSLPKNNRLLRYLLTHDYFYTSMDELIVGFDRHKRGCFYMPSRALVSPSKVVNVAERKISYYRRFNINSANTFINWVALDRVCGFYLDDLMLLPATFDKQLGVGDGVNKIFQLPDLCEDVQVTIDGVSSTDFVINYDTSPDYFFFDVAPSDQSQAPFNGYNSNTNALYNTCLPSVDEEKYVMGIGIFSSLPNSNLLVYLVQFKINEEGIPELLNLETVFPGSYPYFRKTSLPNWYIGYLSQTLYINVETFEIRTSPPEAGITVLSNTLNNTGFPEGFRSRASSGELSGLYSTTPNTVKRFIEFNTAPSQDAVIRATGTTPYLDKTSDHVLDVTFEIQFGEGV